MLPHAAAGTNVWTFDTVPGSLFLSLSLFLLCFYERESEKAQKHTVFIISQEKKGISCIEKQTQYTKRTGSGHSNNVLFLQIQFDSNSVHRVVSSLFPVREIICSRREMIQMI